MLWVALCAAIVAIAGQSAAAPNIVLIYTDDQPTKGVSAYGAALSSTPNIDRVAANGVTFTTSFVLGPICSPSRAVLLTGKHANRNGLRANGDALSATQQTFVDLLDAAEYQTAVFGKWHMVTAPSSFGFDHYAICEEDNVCLYDDQALDINGTPTAQPGTYFTSNITTKATTWIDARDTTKPFFTLLSHKATHGPWVPACAVPATCGAVSDVAQPATYGDTRAGRALPAQNSTTTIYPGLFNHWNGTFVGTYAGKTTITGADDAEKKANTYQAFAKDFIRTTGDLDESVGVLLDYLEAEPCSPTPCSGTLADNTVIIYTADNGLHVADHGLREKHLSYEEAIRVPLLIQYPGTIAAGSTRTEIINNADLAPTILAYAGIAIPSDVQGRSLSELLDGSPATDWRASQYLQFYQWDTYASVVPWYGLRTDRYKLLYHYGQEWGGAQAWELIDLDADPGELTNEYANPAYADVVGKLTAELRREKALLGMGTVMRGSTR